MTLLVFYLFLALVVSFVCSILEAVLLSVTPSYIGSLDDKVPHKKVLSGLKSDIDNAISSILILNTIAHTMGAAGVGAEAVRLFGVQWQSLIAVVLTFLILYVSEIIPKTIGATHWRKLAKPAGHFIAFLIKALKPLLWISRQITRHIQSSKRHGPTRAEISAMAEIGERAGVLEASEGQLIENLMTLKEIRVEHILTPRSVVFSLDADISMESALEEKGVFVYSRIPVYEEERDKVIGMVFSRDILKSTSSNEHRSELLSTILQPVHQVSESMPVFYLLDLFIRRKEHMFVVHDEYHQFSGIVTLEDALETLLGREIIDEADQVVDLQKQALEQAKSWKDRLANKNQPKPKSADGK